MKHLRQRTKTQRANAAILSILTVLSPLQVFGSVLAPIDLEEYFSRFMPLRKNRHSPDQLKEL